MANEINATCTLTVSKASVTVSGNANVVATLAGANYSEQIFSTSTTGAAIPDGGVTTFGGFWLIKNLDAAINVNIYQNGATCTVLIGTLLPGEAMLLKPAAALGVKSVSGTPMISIVNSTL